MLTLELELELEPMLEVEHQHNIGFGRDANEGIEYFEINERRL